MCYFGRNCSSFFRGKTQIPLLKHHFIPAKGALLRSLKLAVVRWTKVKAGIASFCTCLAYVLERNLYPLRNEARITKNIIDSFLDMNKTFNPV